MHHSSSASKRLYEILMAQKARMRDKEQMERAMLDATGGKGLTAEEMEGMDEEEMQAKKRAQNKVPF